MSSLRKLLQVAIFLLLCQATFAAQSQRWSYKRPLICTEYMTRGNGSFFIGALMVGKAHNVWMVNWGLVQGKTQTHLPWDSWERPYTDR
jgi:hypothetical protein